MVFIAMLCVGLNAQNAPLNGQFKYGAHIQKAVDVSASDIFISTCQPENPTRGRDVILTEGFEGLPQGSNTGLPTGWSVIDADGDGNNWYNLMNTGNPNVIPGHTGVGLMSSASYGSAPLTPNNYLITCLVEGATSVNYWVCAQDAAYAYEKYALCYSTTGTNAADFTIAFQEVMVAKAQGTWYERNVNVPAGTKYIAWRHFDCTDAFRLNLDDITIYGGEPSNDCPAVTNVTATQLKGTMAKITWTAPTDLTDFVEYKIYEGSTVLAFVPAGTTTFITNPLAAGAHTFAVEATYSGECTPKKVTTDLTIKTCGDAIEGVAVVYDANCKATVTWDAVAKSTSDRGVLFNGGPMITHQGQGSGGKDASAFTATGQTLLGSNANKNNSYSMADDFTLAAPSTIETIDFYCYQTSSGTGSPTITGVFVQIWNGAPNAGGSVIWGNLTTSIMANVAFADIYRVSTTITNADRPLQKVTANIGNLELEAGTYWVEVSFTGSLTSGPWANPVEIMGQPHTGNGLQKTSTGWQAWTDWDSQSSSGTNEPLALPFVIYGNGGEPPVPKYNVYMGNDLVAPGIEATSYTHTASVAQGVDVEWCVTQVCSAGGESPAGCATKKCGDACDPVIGAKAEVGCKEAKITWTAVIGATGYKIGETTVTGTEYTENGDFENGKTYTWNIVTICASGQSTPVEVSAVAICDGISEFGNTISIYPNPANSTVNIKAENFAKVEVYSSIGQLVVTQNTTTIDVSNYQAGVYFFKVFDNNNNTAMKRISVIKQ